MQGIRGKLRNRFLINKRRGLRDIMLGLLFKWRVRARIRLIVRFPALCS